MFWNKYNNITLRDALRVLSTRYSYVSSSGIMPDMQTVPISLSSPTSSLMRLMEPNDEEAEKEQTNINATSPDAPSNLLKRHKIGSIRDSLLLRLDASASSDTVQELMKTILDKLLPRLGYNSYDDVQVVASWRSLP